MNRDRVKIAWKFDVAARWLIGRKWDIQPEFGEAWSRIRSAPFGQEFHFIEAFTLARQHSPRSIWGDLLIQCGQARLEFGGRRGRFHLLSERRPNQRFE